MYRVKGYIVLYDKWGMTMTKDGWLPKLDPGSDSIYARIVAALERDVRLGAVERGARLPPQRSLADQLNVSVGTVTKAYLEAERRGLVHAHVGRGTFVSDPGSGRTTGEAARDRVIDLSLNVSPQQAAARRFLSTPTGKRNSDLLAALAYSPAPGPDAHRRAAVAWLSRVAHFEPDWTRLLMTSGAQQAMSLVFGLLCRPKDTILCEAATFFGMRRLAEHCDYTLHGIQMDEEGLRPEALERAVKSTGAKVLYTMPTVQNPTSRTMSAGRREDIARVVRRHKLWVVEDDTYAMFAPRAPKRLVPLASILPEQCFYLASVSKSLSTGLRVGFLCCPAGRHFDALVKAVQATVYAPSSLGGVFFSQWVNDGSAFMIADEVKAEIERRVALAKTMLGGQIASEIRLAPHFWLPLPELEAERLAGRALRAGVAITAPGLAVVRPDLISGLRVCLGAASDITELTLGLERLRSVLQDDRSGNEASMV
jgi:DNA-binding transcriptional MocR family regulator